MACNGSDGRDRKRKEATNSFYGEGGTGGKMYDFGSFNSDKALKVSIDMNNGEYALKLTTVMTNNATAEEVHTAAVLLSQAEAAVLRELGEKLFSHIRSRI